MPLLTIPTKPFLRKYIQYQIGSEYLRADGKHHIELLLTALLEKKIYARDMHLEQRFTDKIHRKVPLPAFGGYFVNPRHIIYFNDYIQTLFENDLVQYCRDYIKFFEVSYQLVEQIAQEYQINLTERERRRLAREARLDEAQQAFADKIGLEIEVDITAEYLKKMEYRARMDQQNNLFSKPVPHFSAGQLKIDFSR
jgi:hypothetical protein